VCSTVDVLIYFPLSRVQMVAKWLKCWTADQEVLVLAPLATVPGTLSIDPKFELQRRVTFVSFGEDIKLLVPGDLV